MPKKQFGEYYLGLDMGTESVGWAATDLEYKLLKLNQKSMWGSRLFAEAKTAVDRRTQRIARRRIQRRNQRLALLQDIFKEEIAAIDPSFFVRLQEGMLHAEDKSTNTKYNLFAGQEYTDKDYHKAYPTIYHLRSELIHSTQPHDVRLVYLALHHIIKYRGHFLFEGSMEGDSSFDEIIRGFDLEVQESFEEPFDCSDSQKVKTILCNRDMNKAAKQKELMSVFGCTKKTRGELLLKAITGAKVDAKALFPMLESDDKITIEFGSDSYEALQPTL